MAISWGTIAFASGRLASSSAAQPRTIGDQSPNAATSSVVLIFLRSQIEATGRDGLGNVLLAEPIRWIRTAAGDAELLQRQGVGQNIRGRRTQAVVAALAVVGVVFRLAGPVLLAAVVGERTIAAPHEVEVPGGFLDRRPPPRQGRRYWRPGAPQIAESLAGVAVFAVLVGSSDHLREELRFPGPVALQRRTARRSWRSCRCCRGRATACARRRESLPCPRSSRRTSTPDRWPASTSGCSTPHFLPMTIARLADQPRRVHRAVGRDRAVKRAIGSAVAQCHARKCHTCSAPWRE